MTGLSDRRNEVKSWRIIQVGISECDSHIKEVAALTRFSDKKM